MVALMTQEAYNRDIRLKIRSMAVARRGGCTFVEKARYMAKESADMGIVVNNENALIEMPAGKELTINCSSPCASIAEKNGYFFMIEYVDQG
jgi:hypothetical protein